MGSFRRPPAKPSLLVPVAPADPSSAADRLEQIADLIGSPVEVFTNGVQASRDLRGAAELLEIWDELASDGKQGRLLAFARALRDG